MCFILSLNNNFQKSIFFKKEKCIGTMWDEDNRDFNKPQYPPPEVLPLKASNIVKAHEILRKGLQQFKQLEEDKDLGVYLRYISKEAFLFRTNMAKRFLTTLKF